MCSIIADSTGFNKEINFLKNNMPNKILKIDQNRDSQDFIQIVGTRTHNLKNLDVTIPKNKITIITGLSGSGKSSLAFDTIFAEGQRRYVESLSSYVSQFLSDIERPDFDYIEGLSPAIAIDQKTASRNPRSTVATATEIYDFLRLLFSRAGTPFCPKCGILLVKKWIIETAEKLLTGEYNATISRLRPTVGTYQIETKYKQVGKRLNNFFKDAKKNLSGG